MRVRVEILNFSETNHMAYDNTHARPSLHVLRYKGCTLIVFLLNSAVEQFIQDPSINLG